MQLESATPEAIQMYNEIKDFIYSGVWTKSAKTKEMLTMIDEGAGLIANKLGLSKTNVLASRSQASEKLRKVLGKNLSSNILSNDSVIYENYRYKMQCAIAETMPDSEILFPEILNRLNAFDTEEVFDLSECEKEIDFLSDLSIPKILNRLDSLDRKKLDFILRVLNKPSHYKVEKGSRVKNDIKYQIIGKILYQSDKNEIQQMKEELLHEKQKAAESDSIIANLKADLEESNKKAESIRELGNAKLANARKRIEELEAQVNSLSNLDL